MAAEYRGLSVTEMAALRRVARDADVEVRVVKNRLFLRAAEAAGKPELAQLVDGPTALLFGYDDVALASKAVTEYQRTARNAFAIRLGVMDGQVLSLSQIQDLASLPTRPVLLAQLAGLLQAPVTRLAGLLNGSMQNLAGLLDSRARQLDEQGPAPAAKAEPAVEASTGESEQASDAVESDAEQAADSKSEDTTTETTPDAEPDAAPEEAAADEAEPNE
jgi:large subunit ribosomal protein L10